MTMSEDFSDLCRLCLKVSEFKFSLFSGNILDKVESLTAIKIEEDDRLPKTCCETCVANVCTSYKFQQCIIDSDKILRDKLFGNESHIIEQAKRAPELFEILHVEGSDGGGGGGANAVERLETKLEVIEDCDYVEFKYKVEDVLGKSEHSNQHDDTTTDNDVLQDLLDDRSNTEDDKSNSQDVYGEDAMEYVDVDVLDNLRTISPNDVVCSILSNEVANEKQCLEDIVYAKKNCGELNVKGPYSKTGTTCLEDSKSASDDDQGAGDADNISTMLGISNKFKKEDVAYCDKQKHVQATMECADCGIKFNSKQLLKRHMTKHKIDKCPVCSITMRSDNLKKHIQIHTDAPEICEICGKIAKNKESLRGHINYLHRNSETFKCEPCNKEFKSNNHYKTHVKKIHLGIRNHQCHICGKKFFANHDLKKHINMTHAGARPYICQYCKKGFSSPYARKTHIRQHTLETPYRCEICSAGFRQKVCLVSHLKSKHSAVQKVEETDD